MNRLLMLGLMFCGLAVVAACEEPAGAFKPAAGTPAPTTKPVPPDVAAKAETADFAAGCFWGSEATFRKVPGVLTTEVGYEGGHTDNPTYADVCTDKTGYAETVRVTFDPQKVSYDTLVDTFFANHDPTTADRQGPDAGTQYRSVIFYHSPAQEKAAEDQVSKRDKSGDYVGPIVTQVVESGKFFRAEEYHPESLQKKGDDYTCHLSNGKKTGK